MEQITNSYNLFIDSSTGHSGSDVEGDDYTINLQDAGVTCGDGELIRVNLESFSMAKNFYDVNENNNKFRIVSDATSWTLSSADNLLNPGTIPPGNYETRAKLAEAFKTALSAYILTNTHTDISSVTATSSATDILASGDSRIISCTFTFNTDHGMTATNTCLQLINDSYSLLGGDRISLDATGNFEDAKHSGSSTNSITLTVPTTNTLTFTCKYPCQLSTTPYIYIRAPGTLSKNLETPGFEGIKNNQRSQMIHSNILGRALVDERWIQHTAQTGREFFVDIQQKNLHFLRLMLTDNRGRRLPQTAPGQSTLGNLEFTAIIRIDIIKKRSVHYLETEKEERDVPARFSNGVTNFQRFGRDTFGMAPGY